MDLMRVCTKCGFEKSAEDEFSKRHDAVNKLQSWCKDCKRKWGREYRREFRLNPLTRSLALAADKRTNVKNRHRISLEEKEQIFELQGKKCAACGGSEPRGKKGWVIDHNHATGERRGVLCQTCNIAIGMVGESIERLHGIEAYLRQHQKAEGVGA